MNIRRRPKKLKLAELPNPFKGIPALQFAVRSGLERGAPRNHIRACTYRAAERIVSAYMGERNVVASADEAATLGGTITHYSAFAHVCPEAIIAWALLTHLDRSGRNRWEREEARNQLKELYEYLTR